MRFFAQLIRQSLNIGSAVFCLFLAFPEQGVAQAEFDTNRGTRTWMMFTDLPNALYHHLSGQALELVDQRSAGVANISALEDWQKRQEWVRKTLFEAVGPLPQKTPLNARITRTIEKDSYKVQNIVYESQPGLYVTGAIFLPKDLAEDERYPAVIYCSGHSEAGYRSYQRIFLNLVQKGFIVFAFDPIGQGERLQYYNPETGRSLFRWPSYEHSYVGAQLFLTGSSLARYFIWDGIRAVDYLLTRKEVDPGRIGITGRSGGGTQSAIIAAFDDRIKAAAPENYLTNFKWLYRSMGPQDAEQVFFKGIMRGLDMADLLTVRAPRPALMITTTRDMFPIQGSTETAKEVSKIYAAYGQGSNFRMVTDDAAHSSTTKNTEAMCAFFRKHLQNPGDSAEKMVQSLTADELQVTATGQVSTSFSSETVFSINRKDADRQMGSLKALRKNLSAHSLRVVETAKELSGYREPREAAEPVFTGRLKRKGYVIEKYFIKGEGNYVIPYLLLKPEIPVKKALIYLNPQGKTKDSGEGDGMEWFVKHGFTVLAPDIIGTGETGPGIYKGDSYVDSVSYNLWFASMLIGRSIVGIQAGDVVRLVNLLHEENDITEVYGLAKKEMSPVLLHAAAFNKNIKRIALIQPYSSYYSIATTPDYQAKFLHSTVPGAIGMYDLPDLAASLTPRKLLLVGVTDGKGNTGNKAETDKDISVIKEIYKSNELQIVPFGTITELSESLEKWIN